MKIIDYNKTFDKKKIASSAYRICESAQFPVAYQDVYEHLFANEHLILKLLMDDERNLAGFGVFENYQFFFEKQELTMLYLSGMVIDPKYQGRNISSEIIKNTYNQVPSDFISLRTQNIAMAKALLNLFDDNLFAMPRGINEEALYTLKQTLPFQNMNPSGVIPNCYVNQLYKNLNAIYETFGIRLQETDALAVVIEPSQNKQKVLSRFQKKKEK